LGILTIPTPQSQPFGDLNPEKAKGSGRSFSATQALPLARTKACLPGWASAPAFWENILGSIGISSANQTWLNGKDSM